MTKSEIKNILYLANEKAVKIARKNADDYIKLNPYDSQRRTMLLNIELAGIANLYYQILEQIK